MTRENKLALVIGFALILFVGVLVSDHFSVARTLKEADLSLDHSAILTASQPAVRIIDLNQPQLHAGATDPVTTAEAPAEQFVASTAASGESAAPQGFAGVTEYIVPDLQAQAAGTGEDQANTSGAGGEQASFVSHDVEPGETLMAISRKYFGDGSHVRALAEFNELSDPNRLKPGARLRIPVTPGAPGAPGTTGSPGAPGESTSQASEVAAPESATTMYTVQSTDTLSSIARRFLGSSKRWREILALNEDVITDPDHITPGSLIKVPSPKRVVRLASDRR